MNTLLELLKDQIRGLHNAEGQLIKTLPRVAKRAASENLREIFERQLRQCEHQASRLQRSAHIIGFKLTPKRSRAMEGLLMEAKEAIDEAGNPAVVDAGLLAAVQRIEHYGASMYGTARTLAEHLGYSDIASLLRASLDEKRVLDSRLIEIAESEILAAAPLETAEPMRPYGLRL